MFGPKLDPLRKGWTGLLEDATSSAPPASSAPPSSAPRRIPEKGARASPLSCGNRSGVVRNESGLFLT
jgi:hypothetical protein